MMAQFKFLSDGECNMIKRALLCLLAGIILICSVGMAEGTGEPTGTAEPPAAEAEEEPSEEGESPRPASAYVLVTTPSQAGWLPLPEEEEVSYPIRQVLPDGTETVNVIHLTPEGVYMEDSTCEGHDCVLQGEVTLENRGDRILGNMIICLPNQVTLQLYTPEELLEMMQGQ